MPNQEVEEFFNHLYQKTKNQILMYIVAKCGNTDEIHDIFQETFMEIVKLLKKKGTAYLKQPEAMAMGIAKRKIYQHFNLRQKLRMDKICYGQMEKIEEELTDFWGFTVEEVVIRKEILEQLREILGRQDVLTRRVFYMRFYMEAPLREIAEILEIPEGTVKSRLYRGLKSMKRELETAEDEKRIY